MRISVTALKKKYPNPVRACAVYTIPSSYDEYCVGGTLCLETGGHSKFPAQIELREAFFKARPDLSRNMSDSAHKFLMQSLEDITGYNDIGNFEMAWSTLDMILHWKGGSVKVKWKP